MNPERPVMARLRDEIAPGLPWAHDWAPALYSEDAEYLTFCGTDGDDDRSVRAANYEIRPPIDDDEWETTNGS